MKYKLLKTAGLLFILLNVSGLKAQLVDLGFPRSGNEAMYTAKVAAFNDSNDLWAFVHVYDSTTWQTYIKLCKHNGLFWSQIFKVPCGDVATDKIQLCRYNGDFYMNVYVGDITLNSKRYQNINCILKWNGSTLSFKDTIIGTINDMDTFQNKLMISGNFTKIGYRNIMGLAAYNGSTWSVVGNPADWVNFRPGNDYKSAGQMVAQRNKLYIPGYYPNSNSSKPYYYGLAVYDGNSLSPVPASEFSTNSFMMGEVYAHPDSTKYYASDSLFKTYYCGSGQTKIPLNLKWGDYYYFNSMNERFAYRNGSVYSLKGSSANQPYKTNGILEKYTGTKRKIIYLPHYLYIDIERYIGIFGKERVFMLMSKNNENSPRFYTLDSNDNLSGTVNGRVFLDLDNDGVYNNNDKPLSHQWVKIQPGNITRLTDANGEYQMPGLDSGNYVAELILPYNKLFSTPSNGKHSFNLKLDTTYRRDFAVKYDSSKMDIQIEISANRGWRVRRGFNEAYYITVKNVSAFKKSGSVTIRWDNIFTNQTSNHNDLTFSGNTGTFTFTDLMPDTRIDALFYMRTSVSGTISQKYNVTAILDSSTRSWDNAPENDQDTLKLTMVAGYDPNDKTCMPSGDININERKIQYHINFQNVGNDTAFNVVIVDTIDMRLPLESIVLGSSSHPYRLKIKDNILIFEFNNIKLVDSTTNEPGSKGYLRFSARLIDNLPVNTKVNNRAYIYFDYNEAIITNVASVRLVDRSEDIDQTMIQSNSIKIYPNPVADILTVVNNSNSETYQMYNASGVQVMSGVIENGETGLDVSKLSAGIYILILEDGRSVKFLIQ